MSEPTHETEAPLDLSALRDQLLPAKLVAPMAGVSQNHLWKIVRRGQFPQPAVRLGSKFTRWRRSDVAAWMADPAKWIAAHASGQVSA